MGGREWEIGGESGWAGRGLLKRKSGEGLSERGRFGFVKLWDEELQLGLPVAEVMKPMQRSTR
jgi:hypothetical protein